MVRINDNTNVVLVGVRITVLVKGKETRPILDAASEEGRRQSQGKQAHLEVNNPRLQQHDKEQSVGFASTTPSETMLRAFQ